MGFSSAQFIKEQTTGNRPTALTRQLRWHLLERYSAVTVWDVELHVVALGDVVTLGDGHS